MIVACVMRSGGDFKPEHVHLLRDGVLRHSPDVNFACLSDVDIPGIKTIPLIENWRGWWSKIELFRQGIFTEPVVYFDLDTVITGDIRPLQRNLMTMLEGPVSHGPASGIMAWGYDYSEIYKTLKANPYLMEIYKTPSHFGDQGFIRDFCPSKPALFTEPLYSYKMHCNSGRDYPADALAIYFHGLPRPWQTDIYKTL
jgi:hypothetical protein